MYTRRRVEFTHGALDREVPEDIYIYIYIYIYTYNHIYIHIYISLSSLPEASLR